MKKKAKVWCWFIAAAVAAYFALAPSVQAVYADGGIYLPKQDYRVAWNGHDREVTMACRIWNLGLKPVHLSMEPSCGCLELSWHDIVVGPLQSASLRIDTHTSAFMPGVNKSIAIKTDRKDKQFLFINVEGVADTANR